MVNAEIKLFDVNLPAIQINSSIAMIVAGCNAYVGNYIASEKRVYSEWEELILRHDKDVVKKYLQV